MQSHVRFNRVPEKVPEKAWVQSQVRFNRVSENGPEKVPQKVWEALVQSHVKFNRVPEKVPEISGRLWRRVGPGSTRFQRFRKAWCRAGLGSTRFQRFRKAVVESRARFNEVPEKVLEKVPEGFWCGQVQRGFK